MALQIYQSIKAFNALCSSQVVAIHQEIWSPIIAGAACSPCVTPVPPANLSCPPTTSNLTVTLLDSETFGGVSSFSATYFSLVDSWRYVSGNYSFTTSCTLDTDTGLHKFSVMAMDISMGLNVCTYRLDPLTGMPATPPVINGVVVTLEIDPSAAGYTSACVPPSEFRIQITW